MPFTRTLLALSMGMVLLQNPAFAAPPLSMTDGVAQVSTKTATPGLRSTKPRLNTTFRTLQASLADKSKICAVLKADAYGHGIGLLMPSIIASVCLAWAWPAMKKPAWCAKAASRAN
jgi:alanine racemase